MSLRDAFAPVEAEYRTRVTAATFGHLAPKPRERYVGYVVFVCGAYGDIVVLDASFKGLDDSPWLFEDMNDLALRKATEDGVVYRFDGTYSKCKSGRAFFVGKIRQSRVGRVHVGSKRTP